MQGQAVNLQWLVHPGSVRAALLTGMFGLQPQPTWAEVVAWFAYAVPFLFIVAIPARSRTRTAPAASATPAASVVVGR